MQIRHNDILIAPGSFSGARSSVLSAGVPETDDELGQVHPPVEPVSSIEDEIARLKQADPKAKHFSQEEFDRHMELWRTINPVKHAHTAHGIHLETQDGSRVTVTKDQVTIGNKSDADTIRALVLHAKDNWDGVLSPVGTGHNHEQMLMIWAQCQVLGVKFEHEISAEDQARMQSTIIDLRAREALRPQETPAQKKETPAETKGEAPAVKPSEAPSEVTTETPPVFKLSEEGQKVVDRVSRGIQGDKSTLNQAQDAAATPTLELSDEAKKVIERVSLGNQYEKSPIKKPDAVLTDPHKVAQLGPIIENLNKEEAQLGNDWEHHVSAEQMGAMVPKLNAEESRLVDDWATHVSQPEAKIETNAKPNAGDKPTHQTAITADAKAKDATVQKVRKLSAKSLGNF